MAKKTEPILNILIGVLTSGYQIDKYLDVLSLAKRGIKISVYSSDASTHDSFVGVPGSFNLIKKTVKKAVGLGIEVTITSMLTPNNADDLHELAKVFLDLGVNLISIGEISPIGRAKVNKIPSGNDIPESVKAQMLNITDQNTRIRYEQDGHKTETGSLIPLFLLPCGGGSTMWYVDEYGEIQPCAFCQGKHFSMGNINDGHIDKFLRERNDWMANYAQYNTLHVPLKTNICPIELYYSSQ